MSEQDDLITAVLQALLSGRPADGLLDAQRRRQLAVMRELTAARRDVSMRESMLLDYRLFHLEADLRWIDHTSSRLGTFAAEIQL